jgi:hypothetical protein
VCQDTAEGKEICDHSARFMGLNWHATSQKELPYGSSGMGSTETIINGRPYVIRNVQKVSFKDPSEKKSL